MGEEYAHAEARKSPALDGKVERDSGGKELRYPVILSAHEKCIAKKVCKLFKVLWFNDITLFLFCKPFFKEKRHILSKFYRESLKSIIFKKK